MKIRNNYCNMATSTSKRMLSFQKKENNSRLNINVSGKHFSAKLQHLQKYPDTLLGSDQLYLFYDQVKGEFFFDRDPDLFRFILNYYNLGKLHISELDCPGAFFDELDYFGIPHTAIDECCLNTFSKLKNSDRVSQWGSTSSVNEKDTEEQKTKDGGIKNTQETLRKRDISTITRNDCSESEEEKEFKKHSRKFEVKNQETKLTRLWRQMKRQSIPNGIVYMPQEHFIYSRKTLYYCCAHRAQIILQYIYGLMILASSLCNTVETIDCDGSKCGNVYKKTFFTMETFFIAVFTSDYVVRFILAKNKLTFVKQVLNIVDLLAILPYYLELMFTVLVGASDILITFRVLRVLRLMKLGRNSPRLQTLILTLRNCFKDLLFLYLIFLFGILLFGGAIYYVERDGSNAGNFTSIPHSLWFTCVTMVTTGYGDVIPATVYGKIFAALCGLCGVLIMSLPIPIMQERKANVEK